MKQLKTLALVLAGATLLSACAGTRTDGNGQPKGELSWPKPYSTSFNKNKGTFPDLGSLKQIRPGVTKDQLYYLIGRPQYGEGFRVSEWNYLFHFNTPGQGPDGVTTCQYKVLFDKHRYAQSFHWRAVDPEGAVCPPPEPEPVMAPPPVAPEPQVIIREVERAPAKRIRQ